MSQTITKKSLVESIADATGQRRSEVKKTLQELLNQIVDELGEGNRIEFRDFGVFEVKERAARTAQNPRTLERVAVPAKRTVKFKPGRKMKDILDAEPTPKAEQAQEAPKQKASAADVIATIEPAKRSARLNHDGSHAPAASREADARGEAPEVHVNSHSFAHAGSKSD